MDDRERAAKVRDLQRLYDFVSRQVLAGLYKSDIVDKLIELGVDRLTAADLVDEMEQRLRRMLVRRVLIVAPDGPFAKGLVREFRLAGFQPRAAHEEAAGLALVRELVPDLIILDSAILVSRGLDFLKALRQSPIGRRIPVFLLCGRKLMRDAFSVFKLVHFIEKTAGPEPRIGAVLEQARRIFVLPNSL